MCPTWFVKRVVPIAFIFIALVFINSANAADTSDFLSKLRSLKVGEITQAQAVRLLGDPQKQQATKDGGSVIFTYENNSDAGKGNGLGSIATIAGLAAYLMPTQLGMATEVAAEAAGTAGNVANGLTASGSSNEPSGSYQVLIAFDRESRFISWAGTVNGKKVSSSEGGSIPIIKFPGTQVASPPPADGKAHLSVGGAMLSEITDPAVRAALDAGGFTGFAIGSVYPGGVAERAGLRTGDIIYLMDGTLIASKEDLYRVLNRLRPGDTIWATVLKINDQSNYWTPKDIQISF